MKPPMIPNAGREVDAVNFRSVKESESVDIGAARVPSSMRADLETPGEREVDPFEEFNSGMCGFFFFHSGGASWLGCERRRWAAREDHAGNEAE
jgi:hypothetical protein